MGRGRLLQYSIRLVHTPLPSFLAILVNTHDVDYIRTTAAAFWKNGSFDERVLQEISLRHTKLRGIEATYTLSVVIGDDPAYMFEFQVRAT